MLGTIGAVNRNPEDRMKFMLDLGVKGVVFDTAHFDQGIETYRNVEKASKIIANSRQKVFLVAGNVITRRALRDIFAAGADAVKAGIGPGAMCLTRVESGVGEPQMSVILELAEEADIYNKHVWADGGIQYPRDVALALSAGASQVMIGSMFTPTHESPSPFMEEPDGKRYKINYGMASRQAATLRNLGKLERDMRSIFRSVLGQRSEGINAGKVYQREGLASAADMVHYLMDGVTSAMTYMGARNLDEFRRYARIGVQTMSGYDEGKAKSVS
jgi:IMP dehydrogenase